MPNASAAWVEETKIREYLLNLNHPVGAAKAKFFRNRGFSAEQWAIMRNALVTQGVVNPLMKTVHTEFGTRYTVECNCPTPDSLNPCIRSVWEVKVGNPRPRLITAHPFDSRTFPQGPIG